MNYLYVLVFVGLWFLFFHLLELKNIMTQIRLKPRNNYQDFVNYIALGRLSQNVPSYYFYSLVVEKLIIFKQKLEIRVAAMKDSQMRKKTKEELSGLFFQYLLMAAFTWVFLINTQLTLNISFSLVKISLLLIWQVVGIVMAIVGNKIAFHSCFACFNTYFKALYIFRSLLNISRPISEVLLESNISQLRDHKALYFIKKRTQLLVTHIKTYGSLSPEEFDQLVIELWDVYDIQHRRYKSYLTVLKFVLLFIFVFPSFLFGIFLSLNELVI
jgi:hypothetical protein